MIQPKLLMFDLDGTLVDTLQDIATSANLTRVHFGLAPLPPAQIIALVGDGLDALVRQVVPVPPEQHPEAVAQCLRNYEAHLLDATHLMPGTEAMLRRYSDRVMAVVTNKLERLSERVLTGLGVRPSFRMVVGGDTLTARKPDPTPLLHVVKACGVTPAEAVMIGDGLNDVKAGKAAGVAVIAVLGGVNTRAELEALRPDYLIDSLEALPEVLG